MQIASRNDIGKLRKTNEDTIGILPNDKIFIVADGVAGEKSGDIASDVAVRVISKIVEELPIPNNVSSDAVCTYMRSCIKKANEIIVEMGHQNSAVYGMATTCVMAVIRGQKAYFANVGDSRGYMIRNSHMTQITEDHTYVNKLVKQGFVSEKEALHHEDRHKIVRALGICNDVEVDLFEVSILKDDILVLCSDGLYETVPQEKITSILSEESDLEKCSDGLMEISYGNGAGDNISFICIKIMEDDLDG